MKISLGAKSVVYPAPSFVVGTYDKDGRPNVATAAWCGICCSKPPCVGVSFRKATYTYGNIVEKKAFTVNVPSERYVKEVDFFGIASGRKVDKFAKAGMTPVKSTFVDAPYIAEFPFMLECKLIHTIELGLHTQFIGEIVDVKADEDIVNAEGNIDIEKVKPIILSPGLLKYFGIGQYLGKTFSIGKEL
ncbi:MAG TPA: flavin reductase family protein [Syntrophorhabdaceae bacterium]|nr:Flavoredoxin [Syntrophorhabdaceae bacterium]HOB68204.1 flavin reductase family protein [Syntrophorhabdaceae bacterium]HQM75708.1 flavin reductase family protein [Syntrophorhabdaceae bacterium]